MIFALIIVIPYAFGGILHVLGLFLLRKVKPKPDNQRKILMNLACVEMIYAFSFVLYTSLEPFHKSKGTLSMLFDFLRPMVYAVFQLLMLYILTDKTATIYLNLKYPIIFTETRVKFLLVSFWIFGGIVGLTIVLIEILTAIKQKQVQTYWRFCYLTIDFLIIILLVIQFVYLFRKVKQIQSENLGVHFHKATRSCLAVSKFMLPGVIVGTYIIFCLNSTFFRMFKHIEVAISLECAAVISDALTYILLQKQIRKYLKNKLHFSDRASVNLSWNAERDSKKIKTMSMKKISSQI